MQEVYLVDWRYKIQCVVFVFRPLYNRSSFFFYLYRSEIVHGMMNLLLRYWDLIKHKLVLLHLFVKPLKSKLMLWWPNSFNNPSVDGWIKCNINFNSIWVRFCLSKIRTFNSHTLLSRIGNSFLFLKWDFCFGKISTST